MELPPLTNKTISLTPGAAFKDAYDHAMTETIVQLKGTQADNPWDLTTVGTAGATIIESAMQRFMLLRRLSTSPDIHADLTNRKYEVLDRWTAGGNAPAVVLTYFKDIGQRSRSIYFKL